MRVGLVLLPDLDASAAFVAYSDALVRERRVRTRLGPRALPHLSLLHVETGETPDAAWWAEASRALAPEYACRTATLGLLRADSPYNAAEVEGPGTMAYLIVPCTDALRSAERAALGLSWVRRAEVTTGNGDLFLPHLTLAIWEGRVAPATCELPEDVIGRAFSARPALGVIGANGVYERTLFSGP